MKGLPKVDNLLLNQAAVLVQKNNPVSPSFIQPVFPTNLPCRPIITPTSATRFTFPPGSGCPTRFSLGAGSAAPVASTAAAASLPDVRHLAVPPTAVKRPPNSMPIGSELKMRKRIAVAPVAVPNAGGRSAAVTRAGSAVAVVASQDSAAGVEDFISGSMPPTCRVDMPLVSTVSGDAPEMNIRNKRKLLRPIVGRGAREQSSTAADDVSRSSEEPPEETSVVSTFWLIHSRVMNHIFVNVSLEHKNITKY